MTEQQAFAAIMELNRKHKLGIEPDGWVYFESHKIHKDGWYKEICDPDFGTDVLPVTSPDRIDLQALAATATEWLERERGISIGSTPSGYVVYKFDSFTKNGVVLAAIKADPYYNRLITILAAIEHCTQGSKA